MRIILSAVLGMGALVPAAASASTWTVDTTDDTTDAAVGDGICADTMGDCSLRAAIQVW